MKISVFVCVCAPISFLDNSWIVAFSSLNRGSMIMSSYKFMSVFKVELQKLHSINKRDGCSD